MNEDRETLLSELLKEVRRIEVQSRRLVSGAISGAYVSVFRGAGIEFDEVREYVEGDDPRLVDWNVTARVGRPFIKKFVDERELTLHFLVDLSASMSTGYGQWSLRGAAARIAASLAFSAIRNNDKVGFVGFSEKVDHFVAPRKGPGHVLRIVRECLGASGSSAQSRLAPALDFVARVDRRHAVVFILSDFQFDTGWQKSMAKARQRHDVIAVRLLPPELADPGPGLLSLRDPKRATQHHFDASSRIVRERFQERVFSWRAATEQDLKQLEVDLLDVQLPLQPDRDTIVRPLKKFFLLREQRGRKR